MQGELPNPVQEDAESENTGPSKALKLSTDLQLLSIGHMATLLPKGVSTPPSFIKQKSCLWLSKPTDGICSPPMHGGHHDNM